jgi:hypothetical protein
MNENNFQSRSILLLRGDSDVELTFNGHDYVISDTQQKYIHLLSISRVDGGGWTIIQPGHSVRFKGESAYVELTA